MLTCIYHPIDPMRVVEREEAERLRETGVWFDCPAKAKKYREGVEADIRDEEKEAARSPKSKHKGKNYER